MIRSAIQRSGLLVGLLGSLLLSCSSGVKSGETTDSVSGNPDTNGPGPKGSTKGDDPGTTDPAGNGDPTGPSPAAGNDPNAEPTSQNTDTPISEDCSAPSPGQAPLRRLTNAEYVNTATDLVGDADLVAKVTENFPREPTSLGFRTSAQALTITPLVADEYFKAAQELGKAAVAKEGVVPCDIATADPACTQSFVEDFGKKVYRRPLARADLKRYSDLFNAIVSQTGDRQAAFEAMAATMFSSTNFLFRVEVSQPADGSVGMPTGYEMASRLSYLLWQTMPDDKLFEAAENGDLDTVEGIEAQVKRMVSDTKALRVYEFFEQWLDIDEAAGLSRNETNYPAFNPTLVQLLQAENRAFVYDLLVNQGTFSDLLAADYTFANKSLAEHYGLATVPEGSKFERVDAPDRAGVLTQATLVMHDRPARTSIVKRGLKIRTDFLCQIVPAPPANVDTSLPDLDGSLTQRERLDQHRQQDGCAGCHQLMDPVGEIFEAYDALGKPRTKDEGGADVVGGGSISGTRTLDGDYATPRDLALAMAQSDEVRQCFMLQAFRFFYGRDATGADACTQEQLATSFAKHDYRVVDLLIGLTQSDQFLYRAATSLDAASDGAQP
ncbi:MAG TPA: DUF1592 domain-containing protein [Polyangiaceae bacterium]|jgi:hypothetical protein|nr:DUF1592 domain-containing protein [Polyangiaceae bacterium]